MPQNQSKFNNSSHDRLTTCCLQVAQGRHRPPPCLWDHQARYKSELSQTEAFAHAHSRRWCSGQYLHINKAHPQLHNITLCCAKLRMKLGEASIAHLWRNQMTLTYLLICSTLCVVLSQVLKVKYEVSNQIQLKTSFVQ